MKKSSMAKKHYTKGKGKYYFSIKAGQSNILMHRNTKEEAEHMYLNYKKVGKNVEWLGKWTGKKYAEATAPTATASAK